ATRECTSVLKTPWTYKNITCQTTVSRASESEALDYEIQLDYGGSTHCNLQWTRFGWLTSQATVGYCGNPSPEPQTFYGGNEVSNASKYTFTWETCSNHQPQQLTAFYVQRTRSLVCPTGYSSGGNGYCFIESTQVDRVKNLGKPCPILWQPDQPGTGQQVSG